MSYFKKCPKCGRYMNPYLHYKFGAYYTVWICDCGHFEDVSGTGTYSTQGRKNLARELSHIIDTHLTVSLKEGKENNKVSQRALEKFNSLLDERSYEE